MSKMNEFVCISGSQLIYAYFMHGRLHIVHCYFEFYLFKFQYIVEEEKYIVWHLVVSYGKTGEVVKSADNYQ